MPQMSPLLWVVYPYTLVLVMMVFTSTLIEEGVEMKGEKGVVGEENVVVKW